MAENPFRKPIPSPSPSPSPSASPSPSMEEERKKRELLDALKANQSEFPAERKTELFVGTNPTLGSSGQMEFRDFIPERASDAVKAGAQAEGLRKTPPSPSPSPAKLPAQDLGSMSDKELQGIISGSEYGLAMKIEARKILDSRKK